MPTLYVDTSSMGRIALQEGNGAELAAKVAAFVAAGCKVVSSVLTEVECHRIAVRVGAQGGDTTQMYEATKWLDETYEVDDLVVAKAKSIDRPIKTLDAIHLATASFVPGVLLMTSDDAMRKVAEHIGIALA